MREPATPLRGTVVFVHGLWLNGAEAFVLRRRLAARGWQLRAFRYSELREDPALIVRRCARYARLVARRTGKPVHLLGHSLGGLIIYRMFERGLLAADAFSGDFCRVVFLGTPCGGTRCGRELAAWRFGSRLLGVAGATELLDRAPRRWSFPAQLGVIAGDLPAGLGRLVARLDAPHDGTVEVAETRLPGMTDHLVLHVSHTGMLVAPSVASAVADFLETGRFRAPA